ncbi:helix-turn-helix transcriptional regulator [Methylobacter sp. Wu1]|uniref:helix-turn-helix domain-containing protein n=1 Tax=Methylobacter sp. Wu1 TaxID=3119359 RepID=UPI002F94F3B1
MQNTKYETVFDSVDTLAYAERTMNKLRDTLQKELNRRGWNAYDLEYRSGVPQPTIHRFLKGKHDDLRTKNVEKIARAIGLTESQLRGLEPIPGSKDQNNNKAAEILNSLPKIKELTKSEVESYWISVIIMCKHLITDDLYPDTEESRRALFWEAFDLMARFNYPDIALIEKLLRDKALKNKKKTEDQL